MNKHLIEIIIGVMFALVLIGALVGWIAWIARLAT